MTKTRHLLASAPIAIAAMAALPTAAFAQDAAPIVLDIPPATTPAASVPKPTVVLPEPIVTSAAVPTVTVADPAPATTAEPTAKPAAAAANVSAPERTAATQAPATGAVRAAPVAPSTSEPGAPAAIETAPAAMPAATNAEIAANQAELPPPPAPVDDNSSTALLIALLGMGAVGVIAFLLIAAMRRRTRKPTVAERETIIPVIDRDPVVGADYAAPLAATVAVEPTAPTAASTGAAVDLPAQPPRNEEERGRLIQRMVAARPDRANPFHSHKARAKRARLILQSIGTRFTDRKPGIDLSQYTNVWPELRGWRPATA